MSPVTRAARAALLLSALAVPGAGPLAAGGLADPVVTPEVIEQDTAPSDDWVIPLMALVLFGTALASTD